MGSSFLLSLQLFSSNTLVPTNNGRARFDGCNSNVIMSNHYRQEEHLLFPALIHITFCLSDSKMRHQGDDEEFCGFRKGFQSMISSPSRIYSSNLVLYSFLTNRQKVSFSRCSFSDLTNNSAVGRGLSSVLLGPGKALGRNDLILLLTRRVSRGRLGVHLKTVLVSSHFIKLLPPSVMRGRETFEGKRKGERMLVLLIKLFLFVSYHFPMNHSCGYSLQPFRGKFLKDTMKLYAKRIFAGTGNMRRVRTAR